MLHRTQLMLDWQTKQGLLQVSQATNRSMSELAREWLAEKVAVEKTKIVKKRKRKMSGAEAMLAWTKEAKRIANKYGTSGPVDGSINVDHYMYGSPKKKLS